jgi:hypothetical protein
MAKILTALPCSADWISASKAEDLLVHKNAVLDALVHTTVSVDGTPPKCMDELATYILLYHVMTAPSNLALHELILSDQNRAGQRTAGVHRLCAFVFITNKRELTKLLLSVAGVTRRIQAPHNQFMLPFSYMPSAHPASGRARRFVMEGVGVPFFLCMKLPAKDDRSHKAVYWALMDPFTRGMRSVWNAVAVKPVLPFIEVRDKLIHVNRQMLMKQSRSSQQMLSKRLQLLRNNMHILQCATNECYFPGCAYSDSPRKERLRRCGKCQQVSYCSTEHQTEDWPRHKLLCKHMHEVFMMAK